MHDINDTGIVSMQYVCEIKAADLNICNCGISTFLTVGNY